MRHLKSSHSKIVSSLIFSVFFFFSGVGLTSEAGPHKHTEPKPVKLVHYPQVVSYTGSAWVQSGLDNKFRRAKVKEILREKAILKTEAHSYLNVAIDKDRTITIQESSIVEIPSIAWESGQFTEILLRSGEIFWQQSAAPENNITLKSPVFEIKPALGISEFSYNDEKVLAEAKMFSGAMEFRALNAETSVILTAGKSVKFQGVREDGGVAYDILLKGRRISKGKLLAVQDLPESVMAAYSPTALAARKKADLAKIQNDKNKKIVLRPGQICLKPNGKLNECSWSIHHPGTSCVRTRCNANGVWGEETPLDSGAALLKCKAQTIVGPCDY